MPPTHRHGSLRRIAVPILRTSLILIVGLAIVLKVFEEKFIFYPSRIVAGAPRIPYEEVHFSAADGIRLHAWFIPYEQSSRVFIISHGNAGNISNRFEMGEFIHQQFRAYVLMYDYRGYGKSEGTPTEAGTYADLQGALAYVQSRGFNESQTYLIGQSLGTAVAVDTASRSAVGGVILEAPFPSVAAMVRKITMLPFGFLFSSQFDSLTKISNVQARVAVVHATADPVIPYELGRTVYDAIRSPKRMFTVEGPFHEGVMMEMGPHELDELRKFLFDGM